MISIRMGGQVIQGAGHLDFNKFLDTFGQIWAVCDSRLKCGAIRRIGYVTEHQFEKKDASAFWLNHLTTLKSQGFPAKFNLSFEDRKNTGKGGLPDPSNDDFINVIYNYYDSDLDTDHPEHNFVNANLDVQRYFSPPLRGNPLAEIKKLKGEYDNNYKKFSEHLISLGLKNG